MKTFLVLVEKTEVQEVEVKAKSHEQAIWMALDLARNEVEWDGHADFDEVGVQEKCLP